MSAQWTHGGKTYWVKVGKDYVELHEVGTGLVIRVATTSRKQGESYVSDATILLTYG